LISGDVIISADKQKDEKVQIVIKGGISAGDFICGWASSGCDFAW
jgi:hypothetical protein